MKTIDISTRAPALGASNTFSALRYWVWGGIVDASKIAGKINQDYSSFHISFLTMLLGAMLIAPGESWTPVSSFLRLWMSEPIWGAAFLMAGRLGLHSMVDSSCRTKCWATGILTGCWMFLTTVTVINSGVGLGAFVFGYITWRSGALMRSACRKNC